MGAVRVAFGRIVVRCIILAVACTGVAPATVNSAPNRSPADMPGSVKPVINGFIDMQNLTWHNVDNGHPTFTLNNVSKYPALFGGVVLNATWAEMQTTPGGPLQTQRIDQPLAQVRSYNAQQPSSPLGVKLRIFAGNQAPLWAKNIDGGPITIQRNPQGCPSHNCPITIGKVWDQNYIRAWRNFQAAVAAQYDGEPLIRAVAVTSCSMETDEPFVLPVRQKPPAGYTDAAGQACLSGAIEDYSAWQLTSIDYTFNTFIRIHGGGPDPTFSISVMSQCRAKLGKRCELGNHAFAADMQQRNLVIVNAISRRGAPIHYQTVTPGKKGFDWSSTIAAAIQYNATAIELWPDPQFQGFTTLSVAQLTALHAEFIGKHSTPMPHVISPPPCRPGPPGKPIQCE